MKLIYSDLALITLKEIVDFLNYKWTKKEIKTLRKDISNFEKTVNDGIIKHADFEGYPNTQFALIGKKQVKIIYRVIDSEKIEIALFLALQAGSKKTKRTFKPIKVKLQLHFFCNNPLKNNTYQL